MDMDRPAVAELMADVSVALARRVSVLCEDVYEVILRETPQVNGDKPVHARFIDWVLNELAQQTNDAERANPDIDACTPRLDVI